MAEYEDRIATLVTQKTSADSAIEVTRKTEKKQFLSESVRYDVRPNVALKDYEDRILELEEKCDVLKRENDVITTTNEELEDDVTSLQMKLEKLEECRRMKDDQIRVGDQMKNLFLFHLLLKMFESINLLRF